MRSRAEVTTKCAMRYAKASKKGRGQMLDQVIEVTGWSSDNARRRLRAAASNRPGLGRGGRRARAQTALTQVLL